MPGKKSFGLLAVLLAKLAVDFSNIYVIEGFENPLAYRTIFASLNIFGRIAQFAEYMNVDAEYSTFRNIVDGLGNNNLNILQSNEELQIADNLFNGVPVRIYRSLKARSAAPVMVFYHGGAYLFGNVYTYDSYLSILAKSLNMTIVSVNYRFAPEFPYPIPTDDCWNATMYVLEHAKELNVNTDKLVLAGDSAGGNAAMVTSQRMILERFMKPKLQVLIYPWTQMVNFRLPSSNMYKAGIMSTFTPGQLVFWYLGLRNVTSELATAFIQNNHFGLIEDAALREKYKSFQDDRLIDSKYKAGLSYYDNYDSFRQLVFPGPSVLNASNIFVRDPELARKARQLFDITVSPGLADESILKQMPKTYLLSVEWDGLKDEGLIYAERLRRAGVNVTTAYYAKAFHGMAPMVHGPIKFQLSHTMANDLIDYIKASI